MKQRTWQRCVIGIGSSSFNGDTVEIIGARWRRRLVWKEKKCVSLQRQDKIKRRNNVQEMKSAFTHWANLEAARDDSSMNLNY